MGSTDKLGRRYELQVQAFANGPFITITLPFTIELDITRSTLTSANVCQIRIYNLSLINRNLIRFNSSNYGEFRGVVLKAGYGQNVATIFSGNMSQAWTVREGVNMITQIECYDGGFAFTNGKTNVPFAAGTPQSIIIQNLAGSLPHVQLGSIGSYPDIISRGNTYSGNTVEILSQLSGGGFFIDNGFANILRTNEYIPTLGAELVINEKSGLLNTPVLETTKVTYEMIFEPSLVPGTRINLTSSTANNFNGLYKVVAVKHRGMISEAVCGTLITTGEFFYDKILVPAVRING